MMASWIGDELDAPDDHPSCDGPCCEQENEADLTSEDMEIWAASFAHLDETG